MDLPEPAEYAAFMADVREGFGDRKRELMTDTWWASRLAEPEPEYNNLGEMYRASNRDRGLPAMSEAWVSAHGAGNGPIHRDGLYDSAPPKSILDGDYQRQPVQSPALPTAGESDPAYTRRFDATIRPNVDELSPELFEAATAAYNSARERLDNGTAREDTRRTGDGIGLLGEAPTVRGMQGAVSYRDLAANAAQSAHAVMAAARQAEEAQRITSATVSRSGYVPLAGEAAHTVTQTARKYVGNGGLFR